MVFVPKVITVEFTVPWEERTEEFHKSKKVKYQDLADTCWESGWKTAVFLIVICCRGFPSQSVLRMLVTSTEKN